MAEVILQIEGYHKRDQNEWERARVIAFSIHSHSMAKNKKKNPEKYLPFPWDKKAVAQSRFKNDEERLKWYNERVSQINKINSLNGS